MKPSPGTAGIPADQQQAVERGGLLRLSHPEGPGLDRLSFEASLDPAQPDDGPLRDYLRFYGLDFDQSLDGVIGRSGCCRLAGYNIATHYWLPTQPQGTAFVVHGYFDHVGLYRHLIRHLLEQNLAVVAFDLPGHGISSGERVSIASFDHYVDVFSALLQSCHDRLPGPWHGIGQSTGSAILLKYIMVAGPHHYANPFATAQLLCPLIRPQGWHLNVWAYRLTHRWRDKVPRNYGISSHDAQFLDFVAYRDPLQDHYISVEWLGAMKHWIEEFLSLPPCDYPFHIIQGTADTTVDWQYNLKKMKARLTAAEYTMIEGARHQLVNETPAIRRRVFSALSLESEDSARAPGTWI